jgi:hypothetical protein
MTKFSHRKALVALSFLSVICLLSHFGKNFCDGTPSGHTGSNDTGFCGQLYLFGIFDMRYKHRI